VASSKLKKSAYWVVGLIAAGLVSISLVLSFLDWNQYRRTLSDLASQQMDMRVELAGNVSVALFPRPSVSAETVHIAPMRAENSDVVATADKISLRLGVASFLKGKVAIQSLVLEGLSVAVDEAADGVWRVRGWPKSSESSATDLMRLDIENGRLSLSPLEGPKRLVEALNLNLSGSLPSGPLEWSGDFSLEGQRVETQGRLKPVTVRDEVSVKASIGIGGSDITVSGRIASSGDMTARLLMRGAQMGATYQALSIASFSAVNTTHLPNIPYGLDLQVDVRGGIARLVSRELTLGETRGRLDLTIARKAKTSHMAGSLSLGVIDVQTWRAAMPEAGAPQSEPLVVGPLPRKNRMRLSGAVDVTIEGVRMNGGLGQRIDAVLAFQPEGPAVTSLQALLPGATNLSLIGNLAAKEGTGSVRLEVGNVADLARWAGVQLSDAIPAGRLSTAHAKARLEYRGNVWAFTAIDGALDTSKVSGELSGESGSLVPSHVKLALDTLDLDIFASERTESGAPVIRVPDSMDIGLDISTASLHGFGANLGEARFVGTLQPGRLDVDYLSLKEGEATLRIEGALTNADKDVSLELTADFRKWSMLISRYYVPVLQEYLLAADMSVLDGTASAAGAFSKMRLGFDAAANGQDVSLSGEIGFPENKLTFVNLQGGLKHRNLAGVARLADIGDFKYLPAQLTYALSKSGPGEALEAKVGGDIAGGKMQADVSYLEQIEKLDLSFDHDNVGLLEKGAGIKLNGFNAADGVRAEISFSRSSDGWDINIPSIKNGDRALAGNLAFSSVGTFSGGLSLTEIALTPASGSASDAGRWLGGKLQELGKYAGSVNLAFNNILVAGQRIDAPRSILTVGDGSLRFSSGDSTAINGKSATFDVDALLEGKLPFSVKSTVESLDLAALLASEGIGDLLNSSLSGAFELNGEFGHPHGLMAGLSGSGEFGGTAGQLNFLSVGGLVTQMQSAETGRAFLSDIGSLLRRGETQFGALKTRFSLDGGVMLVETAEANGEWGSLALDGQVNLSDRYLSLKGTLALATPPDTPVIPVQYEGPFDGPKANWQSRLFERFVIAGIERRLRASLFRDMEARQDQGGQTNPGVAVFSRAFGLLTQLKTAQEEKKRREEEARRKAEELKKSTDSGAQDSEE